ncbi:erythromycin esterase family protein [Sphingomonas histidinilytica]|uniref:erythromycin esterase family protein n=1 Tax=Rhizorhabdus histidinilytica TaxID=439228 RepID=UPI001AD98A7B|nr:erythromycin esterase family protein [Rhizorhabdus histidinilytica]MBO9380333.1 erythromycin esterase family protein [Rhizorhabdus histidinilytica]
MIRFGAVMATLGLLLSASAAAEADPAAAFVAWARDHAVPLPACDDPSMAAVGRAAGTARMIALGEPAHGAHEPLAFRNCLFHHLVEQQGFTAIAIESGTSEARQLHDYVAGGPGDVRQLVRESLSWGFGRFAENVALVEWMRAYNADPAHARKIAFYGIDMSGGDSSGAWANARITLDAALAYLARFDATDSRAVRGAVEPFLGRFTHPAHAALSRAERRRLRAAVDGLARYLDRHGDRLAARSGRDEFDWARRNAALARQLDHMFRTSAPSGEELSPEDYRADAARDAAMADNAHWVLDREGPDGRVLLFAHDGHVMNAATRGGIWSVYRRAPKAMGQHLRAALGDQLFIVPIASGSNGAGLPPVAPGSGSLDVALARVGYERFLLDLRPARTAGPAAGWLRRTQSIRANHVTQAEITPATAMDAVVFIATLTAAHVPEAR